MIKVLCQICCKEFLVKFSHLKYGWCKYCSRECQYKSQLKGRLVNCFICGNEFYKSPAKIKHSESGNFFCGKKCQAIWRNTYFSGDKSANWKGGTQTYRSILIRSDQKRVCVLCKTDNIRVLVAHHIDHNRKNNKITNLTWLCMNCHYLVHHDLELDRKIKQI